MCEQSRSIVVMYWNSADSTAGAWTHNDWTKL